jgi:hypothetical protein
MSLYRCVRSRGRYGTLSGLQYPCFLPSSCCATCPHDTRVSYPLALFCVRPLLVSLCTAMAFSFSHATILQFSLSFLRLRLRLLPPSTYPQWLLATDACCGCLHVPVRDRFRGFLLLSKVCCFAYFVVSVALSGSLALLSLWCLGTPGIRSTTSLS